MSHEGRRSPKRSPDLHNNLPSAKEEQEKNKNPRQKIYLPPHHPTAKLRTSVSSPHLRGYPRLHYVGQLCTCRRLVS
ncbi:hypothetical protein BDV06DRAFT_189501 [Aspergillus oleicola]